MPPSIECYRVPSGLPSRSSFQPITITITHISTGTTAQLVHSQSSASDVAPWTCMVVFQTPKPLSVMSRPARVMGPVSHLGALKERPV